MIKLCRNSIYNPIIDKFNDSLNEGRLLSGWKIENFFICTQERRLTVCGKV